jgi:hypothetical protein
MTWTEAWNAIRTEIRKKNLPTSGLEALAREVPLKAPDEHHALVGGVIESELTARYVTDLTESPLESILAEVAKLPEQYTDRVDSARSNALQRVLEIRFPSEPDDPDPIDTYDNAAGLTFGQHLANWYRALNNND